MAYAPMTTYVDSACNHVRVRETDRTFQGRGLLIVRLVDDPSTGYIALVDDVDGDEGGFGDAACPSSYRRPCMGWFGAGERYLSAEAALEAIAD